MQERADLGKWADYDEENRPLHSIETIVPECRVLDKSVMIPHQHTDHIGGLFIQLIISGRFVLVVNKHLQSVIVEV